MKLPELVGNIKWGKNKDAVVTCILGCLWHPAIPAVNPIFPKAVSEYILRETLLK